LTLEADAFACLPCATVVCVDKGDESHWPSQPLPPASSPCPSPSRKRSQRSLSLIISPIVSLCCPCALLVMASLPLSHCSRISAVQTTHQLRQLGLQMRICPAALDDAHATLVRRRRRGGQIRGGDVHGIDVARGLASLCRRGEQAQELLCTVENGGESVALRSRTTLAAGRRDTPRNTPRKHTYARHSAHCQSSIPHRGRRHSEPSRRCRRGGGRRATW
jgi:hypothetical protein